MFLVDENIVEAYTIGMRRVSKHGSAFRDWYMVDYHPNLNGAIWSTHLADAFLFEKGDAEGAMEYMNKRGRDVFCTLQTSEAEFNDA